jgi:hypothetical protein
MSGEASMKSKTMKHNRFRIAAWILTCSAAVSLVACYTSTRKGPADKASADNARAAEPALPAAALGKPVIRRINEDEYRQIVLDVFGPTISVGGPFEPDIREDYLLAIGASRVSISASGLEADDKIARDIAAQVVSKKNRATLVPCKPASETEPDAACAGEFLGEAGRLLYRRPLTQQELSRRVALAGEAAKQSKDFYEGLAVSLATMLETPAFLFRTEKMAQETPGATIGSLDAYSKATRLSFFLWNTAPDEQLLTAAEKGELDTKKGLTRQVDRMLASPRFEEGTRAFFSDMLGFDGFKTLTLDPIIYRKFNPQVAADAQEQTLRTITDQLLTRKGDYRDLFTSTHTFLTPLLASIYKVPFPAQVTGNQWVPYDFPKGDPRAGLLAQVAFVTLHSHPGRTSPTLRGKALRELVLCQKVPSPPANVNFTLVEDTKNPQYKTARARLEAHRTDAICAGCHKIMDPMGLALETFDSDGEYRTTENGISIDTSGELNGVKFADSVGLANVVHDSPATSSCLVNRLYAYGQGRPANAAGAEYLAYLEKGFVATGYKFPDLIRAIATSDAFYRVSAPEPAAENPQTVKLSELR